MNSPVKFILNKFLSCLWLESFILESQPKTQKGKRKRFPPLFQSHCLGELIFFDSEPMIHFLFPKRLCYLLMGNPDFRILILISVVFLKGMFPDTSDIEHICGCHNWEDALGFQGTDQGCWIKYLSMQRPVSLK